MSIAEFPIRTEKKDISAAVTQEVCLSLNKCRVSLQCFFLVS